MEAASARIHFGPFAFDASRMELARDGAIIPIGSRAAALLYVLLEARGNVVPKDILLKGAWPGTIVEESNLAVQMGALRKALGTQQSGQEWIVTVPRLGYRLPMPVAVPVVADEPEIRRPALAVLPFQNLSADSDHGYVADGIVEDITTALSRFSSFAVVSRTSAQAYKSRTVDVRELGKELGVRYVLEGAVRSAGHQLRINAQLVETENGTQLWAQRFDGEREALFDAQDRLTESVVAAIQPNITRSEVQRARLRRTKNPTAYDLYLRALPHLYFRDGKRASDLLEKALELDPDFALAAALAGSQYLASYFLQLPGTSLADRERGVELLNRVLPMCGSDSTLLANCGLMLSNIGEYDRALELARRAVTENPNDSVALGYAGVVCLFGGDLEEALAYELRALALNPNEYSAHGLITCVSHIKMCEADFEGAIDWARRSLAVSPVYTPTFWMLVAGNAHLGRLKEAQRHLAELMQIDPLLTIAKLRLGQHARDSRRVEVVLEGLLMAGMAAA